ncbi:MAG: FKBP-type peptidyl-prolyl cis-trans isomerase [Bacteroidales bacterium]|nr:FKBP-type peptidyl-prolyl cis-trans isomerase [Bacteroidales bacterium]
MKTINLFAASAMLFAAVACTSNKPSGDAAGDDNTGNAPAVENSISAKGLLPSKSEIDSVSYLVGINFGSFIKGYNLGDLNFNEIKKGINDFVNAKGNQNNPDFTKQFKVNPEEMNTILTAFMEKRNAYTSAVNKEAQAKFLNDVKKNAGVQTSPTGLAYLIKETGSYNRPGPQDTVFVHYKLSLKDGTVIEEVTEDQPSVMLTLDRVIPGWTEGLQLMGEGGKATLYVPSELGYGERGSNAIEPNTPLVFDIQLDSIKRFVPVE